MRSLGRVGHLVGDDQAELQADVVGREDFLSRHDQRALAEVLCAQCEVPTPADVSPRTEDFDELALVIEQAGVAFRHEESVTEFLRESGNHDAAENGDDDYDENDVVHVRSPF